MKYRPESRYTISLIRSPCASSMKIPFCSIFSYCDSACYSNVNTPIAPVVVPVTILGPLAGIFPALGCHLAAHSFEGALKWLFYVQNSPEEGSETSQICPSPLEPMVNNRLFSTPNTPLVTDVESPY